MKKQNAFKWWHGLLFYAGVQALQWGLRSVARRTHPIPGAPEDRGYYRKQLLPLFAPPGLAFPIAWSINSASSIAGGLHVLNCRRNCAPQLRYLRLQALAWLLFASFNTAYFELRSPLNGAAVTLAYSAVTAASIRAAIQMRDFRAAVSLLPSAAWLCLASPLALAVAAWNRDEFWNLDPIASPPRWLLKSSAAK